MKTAERLEQMLRERAGGPKAERRPAAPRKSLPCVHEGNVLERCHTCGGGGEGRHVRECDVFGTCTRAKVSAKVHACDGCERYEPDPDAG